MLTYEQAAAAWKSVKRTPPFWASLSILGVRISPPKQPRSEKPRSSATAMRKLGRLGAMTDNGRENEGGGMNGARGPGGERFKVPYLIQGLAAVGTRLADC